MTVPTLEFRGLTKSFGSEIVFQDLSFTVEPGEVVALTGPNGSGKSTLIKCLLGLESLDAGQVLFEGAPYQDARPAVRAAVAVGISPGDDFLDLTVREHLELMARAHGNGDPGAMIDAVLLELDLEAVQHQFPMTLSQGQRRRMGLGSCLVRPRRLLVLDEPEQNLDQQGREWLAAKLLAEKASGVAVLVASHYHDLVDRVADFEVELPIDGDDQ